THSVRTSSLHQTVLVYLPPSLCLTVGVPAALAWYNPGQGVAFFILGQTSGGSAILLPDLPVSLSTESTGLSLHPVGNLNLHPSIRGDVKKHPICLSNFLLSSTYEKNVSFNLHTDCTCRVGSPFCRVTE
uniref:Uncharacterized protein n=1 Tax=Amphiprion percula TaxID=161767 RepID=A0A3P8S2Z1_AMPPE